MPRSAVKVSKSPFAHVCAQQQRALDLEKQLAAASNDTEKANKLRVPLCETLSDILLTDPEYALRKDVLGRLWRQCFYSRISPLRSKIAKEKRKPGQGVAAKVEKSLNYNLAESVTLYDYLAQRLLAKLSGQPTASQSQQTQDSESQASTVAPPPVESNEGVVECLFRLYICLGDLYRYSMNLSKAEHAYTTASKLGYGHGHGFNQLAVLCQVKDSQGSAPLSAVALYWYTRALMVPEAFVTAHGNLTRLLASNRVWLQKQEKSATVTTAGSSSKSVESRRFLAHFVDLQYHFLQGSTNDMDEVLTGIDAIKDMFQKLLQNSALGDALLCKLVTILAFGECLDVKPQQQPKEPAPVDDSVVTMTSMRVAARIASLTFGNCLADRVLRGLTKLQTTSNNKLPPSVRLLLPLLLLSEYLASRPATLPVSTETELVERHDDKYQAFWSKIAEVLNLLQSLVVSLELDSDGAEINTAQQLNEYLNLRGYLPFQAFCTSSSATGFLTDDEAIALLRGSASDSSQQTGGVMSLTQESSTTATSAGSTGSRNPDQTRLKVLRFLELGKRLVGTPEMCMERNSDGTYVWKEDIMEDEPMDQNVTAFEDNYAADNNEPMEEEEMKQDVLVYKQAASGGPALLVPGALLQEQAEESVAAANMLPPANNNVLDSVALQGVVGGAGEPMDVSAPVNHLAIGTTNRTTDPLATVSLAAPTGAPPGLAPVHPSPAPAASVLPPPPPGFAGAGAAFGGGVSAPLGAMQVPPGFALDPTASRADAAPVHTLGESLDLFGGSASMRTANPFVDASTTQPAAPTGLLGSLTQSDALQFETPDDGASLLDSGLLTSLWMDDKNKTKNPFAT